MKLGWYVYLRTSSGALVPVVGFWRKRSALRFMDENQAACKGALEVRRWSWSAN
ncbi:hypothetical protein [Mycolicibacterium porcinum]|uniref:hypothetical protein n=1 Tax=Mycolicibacterium porcinum TaxID=39693 RepID=UPI0013F4EDEF|nr:hypothetical protein [Mycolicibacterium porcinum]